ncbi:YrrS family protein [Neobacillus sp. NRS-1170]|uniref:YrrS family protein n=1 Tax=Neobacillus sp. NRS-1170 TaxID=3233898 RepID=UPI003D2A7EE7
MSNDLNQSSRFGHRAKRKKTNLVLNSLIIIVLLLIIFVAYNIFSSGDDNAAAPKKDTPKTEQKQKAVQEKKDKNVSKEEEKSSEDVANNDDGNSEDSVAPEQADDSQAVVSEGGSSSDVSQSVENPSWKPVGTTQSGEHTPVYDQNSADWQEMLAAMSYATGIDQSNMTVYWLGRDKSTQNASIGTIESKDTKQKYRVYIKWVDGQGWMPTKVEQLSE